MNDVLLAKLGLSMGALSDPDTKRLMLIGGRIRDYRAGMDIVAECDAPRRVRLILAGWACRYKLLPDGRRQTIALLLPGDICNHDAFAVEGIDHSVAALRPVRLREIERVAFEELKHGDGALALGLRRAAAVEAAIQREWTFNVGRRNARERMAHLLCELTYRLAAVGLVEADSYDMPLSQIDLANALCLTPVHVNRTLRVLRRTGLIMLEQRRLTIPDLKALERFALFDPAYLHIHTKDEPG